MTELETTDELRGLVYQSVGLVSNEDKEEAKRTKSARITRITHHEIKAMRATTTRENLAPTETASKLNQGIIRLWFELAGLFKPRTIRDCSQNGHQCVHCGDRIDHHALRA